MKTVGVTIAGFHLGAKGRVVLPAAVRREAHIFDGADLVAHAAGHGRIVIETRESIRARVWDAAPSPTGFDATVDVRTVRTEDGILADANAAARSAQAPLLGAGDALLAHLGLA
jgi:bifunctional DNA-binding transcriptional regulator/antitoxin component of YhaV-PrlF toxin-antitoxin module